MKKLNYFLLAAAGLVLASCSQDEVAPGVANGDGNATFIVTLPKDLSTRAIGDGTAATNLAYYVYEVGGTTTQPTYTYAFTGSQTFTGSSLSTTVNMELVVSKNYKIVFFAYNSAAMPGTETGTETDQVYSINSDNGTLTVNYSKMTSEDNLADDYACFLGTYTTNTISSGAAINANVELTRPVAQVNWGSTGDLSGEMSNLKDVFGANGAYIQTTLSVNAYSTLNMLTGQCDGQTTVTLADFAAPLTLGDDAPDFPETGDGVTYNYVAMQYLLAPSATSTNYDLTLTITNKGDNNNGDFENEIVVSSAPVQANYQTNIYGSLLAASATFSVTKTASWGGTNNMPLKWDGTSTTPEIDTDAMTVNISKASDLAGLADIVNGTKTVDGVPADLADYEITLDADFDMGGQNFPQIGSATRSAATVTGNQFKGTFDGQNHTISNVKITSTATGDEAVGFIGAIAGTGTTVKDLYFENLEVSAPNSEMVGGVIGAVSGGATVSNVNVNSGTVSGKNGVGGVVGRVVGEGSVESCSNGATVSGGDNVGGVIGAAYRTLSGKTMTVTECENTGNVSGNSQAVGGVVGLSAAEVSGCTNSGTISNTSSATGGIVGQQVSAGSISGCTNTGEVIGGTTSSLYGAGGIVGWIRYQENGYQVEDIIEIYGNTNSGKISGPTGVGGIVGAWYQCGICYGNTNLSTSLSGTQYVAGIVGGSQWIGEAISSSLYQGSGNVNMLYVQYNYSTTTQAQMGGSSAACPFIYVNDASKTTVYGNSMTDESVVKTLFTPADSSDNNNSF